MPTAQRRQTTMACIAGGLHARGRKCLKRSKEQRQPTPAPRILLATRDGDCVVYAFIMQSL